MGCDIHMHIELKTNGKWEHYAQPNIDRNYDLFWLMAGVRGSMDIEPISLPKGLPDDLSVMTKFCRDYMGNDGHSDSWLNADEILVLSDTLEKWSKEYGRNFDLEHIILRTYFFGNSFAGHKKYDDCPLPDGIEDMRFIFWFDS